jgi:hypothetical protein
VPRFQVIVHGQGVAFPIEGVVATQFFKPVYLRAPAQHIAESRALEKVRLDWLSGQPATVNQGEVPSLTVDSVEKIPWWTCFFNGKPGYVFTPDDTHESA